MYKVLGRGAPTKIADMLGVWKEYLSRVLDGTKTSAPLLARIEIALDDLEEQS